VGQLINNVNHEEIQKKSNKLTSWNRKERWNAPQAPEIKRVFRLIETRNRGQRRAAAPLLTKAYKF
jgi:hypothetical protein